MNEHSFIYPDILLAKSEKAGNVLVVFKSANGWDDTWYKQHKNPFQIIEQWVKNVDGNS